jgi:hypothetical protein
MKAQEENLKMMATISRSLDTGLSNYARQITNLLDNVPTAATISDMVRNAVANAHSAPGHPDIGRKCPRQILSTILILTFNRSRRP